MHRTTEFLSRFPEILAGIGLSVFFLAIGNFVIIDLYCIDSSRTTNEQSAVITTIAAALLSATSISTGRVAFLNYNNTYTRREDPSIYWMIICAQLLTSLQGTVQYFTGIRDPALVLIRILA